MGKKRRGDQEPLWVSGSELPRSSGHPFYERLNGLLESGGFDEFAESECARFYAERLGRPSLPPGMYFRLLLLGYFEGLDSERGIAWRAQDSLSIRRFLGLGVTESSPDHSTISRTRRLIDVETHGKVFSWVLGLLSESGLVSGKTVGVDATTLEANAALRSIVRRDTGEDYEEFVRGLAEVSGVATPTRAELARFDRKRKKQLSNAEWENPHDPDAQVTKMKDGRMHLAYKAEQAVDLECGTILGVTLHGGAKGDTESLERPFAHQFETAGMRRLHLRGCHNALKRVYIHACAFNLGLLMHTLVGVGTPRSLQGRPAAVLNASAGSSTALWERFSHLLRRILAQWRENRPPFQLRAA